MPAPVPLPQRPRRLRRPPSRRRVRAQPRAQSLPQPLPSFRRQPHAPSLPRSAYPPLPRPPTRASLDSVFAYPSPALTARCTSIPSSRDPPSAPRWVASIDNLRAASQHALPWRYPYGYADPACASALAQAGADDDIIPNAIVIKNIPFSLPKESLSALMADLRLPQPYAFNYHFDQGLFRGLAFANFHTPEEADQVVVALQGFDVAGRKLKTEYKKVLQAGEKERIEKEKALKRMQSLQMEKENEQRRRQRLNALHAPATSPLGIAGMPSPIGPAGSPLISIPGRKDELNMNDPTTLDIYSRVVIFKEDRMRDALAFSKSLSPLERRVVHLVAQRLSLFHYSTGVGEERCVVVSKVEPVDRARTQSAQSRRLRTKTSATALSSVSGLNFGAQVPDLMASQARISSMRSFAALRHSAGANARANDVRVQPPSLPEPGALPSLLADLRLDHSSSTSSDPPVPAVQENHSSPHTVATQV